jgi:hypothetical protein
MADDGTTRADQRQPGPGNFRILWHERQFKTGDDARADDALPDIDDHNAKRKNDALGPQRVGATGVAAAHRTDVDTAAKFADQHCAHERAYEIADQKLDAQFQHPVIRFATRDRRIVASPYGS